MKACLPGSQGRSGSVGRFPGLLTQRPNKEIGEIQGKGLSVLLTLKERTGTPLDKNRYLVSNVSHCFY